MKNFQKIIKFTKSHLIFFLIILIFVITFPIIILVLNNLWVGPDNYTIYVVSDFSDSTSSSNEIFASFKEELKNEDLSINGIDIKIVDRDDRGDPLRAAYIADEISKNEQTLMVVGHFSSTPTKAALPAYLGAEPPIPVILTTETNPDLIPPRFSNVQCPIFRLSPNDKAQAKKAASFARSKKEASAFWVVEDNENAVYSSYLTLEFIKELQDAENKGVVLYTKNRPIPPANTLQTLNINCVFFAGNWSNALILIRQVKAVFKNKDVMIILSDAAVNIKLLESGKDVVEGVYLISQMDAQKYLKYEYNLYGKDAAKIVQSLIEKAGNNSFKELMKDEKYLKYKINNIFNIQKTADVRYLINLIMGKDIKDKTKYVGDLEDNSFFFDANGFKQFSP